MAEIPARPDQPRSLVDSRTVCTVGFNVVAIALVLFIVYAARRVVTWILVALFLALDPGVR